MLKRVLLALLFLLTVFLLTSLAEGDQTKQSSSPSALLIQIGDKNRDYHIGDARFEGRINSQFRYPDKKAEAVSITFNLPEENFYDLLSGKVQLNLLVKGVQQKNPVFINNYLVGHLEHSNSDGSYTETTLTINACTLKAGKNSLTIKGHKKHNGDIDDFEFTRIRLIFQPDYVFSNEELENQWLRISSITAMDPSFTKTIKEVTLDGSFSIMARAQGICDNTRDIIFVKAYPKSKGPDYSVQISLVETGKNTGVYKTLRPFNVIKLDVKEGDKIYISANLRGTSVRVKSSNICSPHRLNNLRTRINNLRAYLWDLSELSSITIRLLQKIGDMEAESGKYIKLKPIEEKNIINLSNEIKAFWNKADSWANNIDDPFSAAKSIYSASSTFLISPETRKAPEKLQAFLGNLKKTMRNRLIILSKEKLKSLKLYNNAPVINNNNSQKILTQLRQQELDFISIFNLNKIEKAMPSPPEAIRAGKYEINIPVKEPYLSDAAAIVSNELKFLFKDKKQQAASIGLKIKNKLVVEIAGQIPENIRKSFIHAQRSAEEKSRSITQKIVRIDDLLAYVNDQNKYFKLTKRRDQLIGEEQKWKAISLISSAILAAIYEEDRINKYNALVIPVTKSSYPAVVSYAGLLNKKFKGYYKVYSNLLDQIKYKKKFSLSELKDAENQYFECLTRTESERLSDEASKIKADFKEDLKFITSEIEKYDRKIDSWWLSIDTHFSKIADKAKETDLLILDAWSQNPDIINSLALSADSFQEFYDIYQLLKTILDPETLSKLKSALKNGVKDLIKKVRSLQKYDLPAKDLESIVRAMKNSDRLFGSTGETIKKLKKYYKTLRQSGLNHKQALQVLKSASSEEAAKKVLSTIRSCMTETAKELGNFNFQSVGTGIDIDRFIAGIDDKLPDPSKWNFIKNDYDVTIHVPDIEIDGILSKGSRKKINQYLQRLGYKKGTPLSEIDPEHKRWVAENLIIDSIRSKFMKRMNNIPPEAFDNMYFVSKPTSATKEELISEALRALSPEARRKLQQYYFNKYGDVIAGMSKDMSKQNTKELIDTLKQIVPESDRKAFLKKVRDAIDAPSYNQVLSGKVPLWKTVKVAEDDAFITHGGKKLVEIMQSGNNAFSVSSSGYKKSSSIVKSFNFTPADGADIVAEMNTFYHFHGNKDAGKISKYFVRGAFGRAVMDPETAAKARSIFTKKELAMLQPEVRMAMIAELSGKFTKKELTAIKQAVLLKYPKLLDSSWLNKIDDIELRGIIKKNFSGLPSITDKNAFKKDMANILGKWYKEAKNRIINNKGLYWYEKQLHLKGWEFTQSRLDKQTLMDFFGMSAQEAERIARLKYQPGLRDLFETINIRGTTNLAIKTYRGAMKETSSDTDIISNIAKEIFSSTNKTASFMKELFSEKELESLRGNISLEELIRSIEKATAENRTLLDDVLNIFGTVARLPHYFHMFFIDREKHEKLFRKMSFNLYSIRFKLDTGIPSNNLVKLKDHYKKIKTDIETFRLAYLNSLGSPQRSFYFYLQRIIKSGSKPDATEKDRARAMAAKDILKDYSKFLKQVFSTRQKQLDRYSVLNNRLSLMKEAVTFLDSIDFLLIERKLGEFQEKITEAMKYMDLPHLQSNYIFITKALTKLYKWSNNIRYKIATTSDIPNLRKVAKALK